MPEFPGRLRTPRLAAAPSSPVVGEMYYDTVANKLYWWNGTAWVEATGGGGGGASSPTTFRTGHTWMISGAVAAATLPPIFVPEMSGQTTTLVAVRAQILSGTNVTAQMQRNGVNLGSPITITTTPASTVFSQAITDLDQLGMVLSAPTGSPVDLSVTAILEHATLKSALKQRVYRNAALNVSDSAFLYVSFDTEDTSVQTPGMWNSGNPTRLVAPEDGLYNFFGQVEFGVHATGVRGITVRKDGSDALRVAQEFRGANPTAGMGTRVHVSGQIWLTIGNYLELGVYQGSGTSLPLTVGAYTCAFLLSK